MIFDPELVELTITATDDRTIDVYKIGGGTLGRAYDGLWGYRIVEHGRIAISGEDLRVGIPKTHREAAELALDIFDTKN